MPSISVIEDHCIKNPTASLSQSQHHSWPPKIHMDKTVMDL